MLSLNHQESWFHKKWNKKTVLKKEVTIVDGLMGSVNFHFFSVKYPFNALQHFQWTPQYEWNISFLCVDCDWWQFEKVWITVRGKHTHIFLIKAVDQVECVKIELRWEADENGERTVNLMRSAVFVHIWKWKKSKGENGNGETEKRGKPRDYGEALMFWRMSSWQRRWIEQHMWVISCSKAEAPLLISQLQVSSCTYTLKIYTQIRPSPHLCFFFLLIFCHFSCLILFVVLSSTVIPGHSHKLLSVIAVAFLKFCWKFCFHTVLLFEELKYGKLDISGGERHNQIWMMRWYLDKFIQNVCHYNMHNGCVRFKL